jgi:hypothetical protein
MFSICARDSLKKGCEFVNGQVRAIFSFYSLILLVIFYLAIRLALGA